MFLELLQHVLGVEARVSIVEPSHKSKRNNVVFRAVNPSAAIFMKRQRVAHGVNDFAGGNAAGGNFPEFLYTHPVRLRVARLIELETSDQLLGKRAACALGENNNLGAQIVSGLEVAFLLAALIDTFIV